MAKREPKPDAGEQKQQPLKHAQKEADQSGHRGAQPNQIAQETRMKRQGKKMHEQDNR